MANGRVFQSQFEGGDTTAMRHYGRAFNLVMAAGAEVKQQVDLPSGAILTSVVTDVPTAISGSPTNINFKVGTASDYSGGQVVAAADIKAQGHTTHTIVAAFDKQLGSTGKNSLYLDLAAVGGTNPAGTVRAYVNYLAPVN